MEVATHNIKDIKVISIPDDIARLNELGLLDALLLDRTTGKNILWATDVYAKLGDGFAPKDVITPEKITGANANNIRRRSVKDKDEKNALTRAHAEVFTPAWIVKLMVDEADAAWSENELKQKRSDGWQKYVSSPRLEITCGEAPFLVNRYDAADGSVTPLDKRTGILSRKLALVNENTKTRATWLKWATIALQSIYGYEFQGDNLLIARVNVLCTMEDYREAAGYKPFDRAEYARFAEIISWNLWQMDGLTNCVPFGVAKKESIQKSLFDSINETNEEEQYGDCVIFDWKNGRSVEFASIRKGSDMKFDYIIGNPPYQEETDNNNQSKPLYNLFIDSSREVADAVELITPARFLSNQGATPLKWNKKMLNDRHFKVLKHFSKSKDVFPNTDIKGGIIISYVDKNQVFSPIETFIPFPCLQSIYLKVKSSGAYEKGNLGDWVYSPDSYRFSDALFVENPGLIGRTDNSHAKAVSSNVFERYPEIFYPTIQDDGYQYVRICGRSGNTRTSKFVKRNYLANHPNLEKWKVIIPGANGSGAIGEVLATPLIGHTQTFISIGALDSKYEAESLFKYIKTKFARALLGIMKTTQNNQSRTTWSKVPLQDFTSNSDIDWSQSVAEIDVQLYKKYGLTDEEIDFIEKHVKAMD